jgi:hypothetical protein
MQPVKIQRAYSIGTLGSTLLVHLLYASKLMAVKRSAAKAATATIAMIHTQRYASVFQDEVDLKSERLMKVHFAVASGGPLSRSPQQPMVEDYCEVLYLLKG